VSVLAAEGIAAADAHPRCPGCDAPLAGDERFCVACGLRLAPDELRLAALPLLAASALSAAPALGPSAGGPAFRRPVVRSAAITAVVVLALGIAIGATIGPAAVGETAAAQRPVILVSAPAAAAPAAAPLDSGGDASGDGSGGDAPDEVQTLADADASDAGDAADAPAAEAPSGEEPPADDAPPGDAPADGGETPPATPPPGSQPLAGVVVATVADGEGFTLAARDGRLLHVHASGCGVALGDDLHLRARPLANETWAADRVRRVGAADTTRVAGTVVWTDAATGRYALGARGVLLLVTPAPTAPTAPTDPQAPATPPAPPATPADPQAPATPPAPPAAPPAVPANPQAPAAPPALGAQLRVRLEPTPAHDGQPVVLLERVRRDAPPAADPAAPAPPLELAGVVLAVDAQARTLALALDPDAQPPLAVSLAVPPSIDLTKLLPAQHVAVTAVAQPDGSLALSGISPDGDALAADDATAFQGDQAPSEPSDGVVPTTTAACTALDGPARAAAGLKTFTSPPPDRNEG
jgi:hypothetical protein